MPLIYVGGCSKRLSIERVLDEGFDAVQMARSLLAMPDFVRRMEEEGLEDSGCEHVNYCIGRMYTLEMKCHHCENNLPDSLKCEIAKIKERSAR